MEVKLAEEMSYQDKYDECLGAIKNYGKSVEGSHRSLVETIATIWEFYNFTESEQQLKCYNAMKARKIEWRPRQYQNSNHFVRYIKLVWGAWDRNSKGEKIWKGRMRVQQDLDAQVSGDLVDEPSQ